MGKDFKMRVTPPDAGELAFIELKIFGELKLTTEFISFASL